MLNDLSRRSLDEDGSEASGVRIKIPHCARNDNFTFYLFLLSSLAPSRVGGRTDILFPAKAPKRKDLLQKLPHQLERLTMISHSQPIIYRCLCALNFTIEIRDHQL